MKNVTTTWALIMSIGASIVVTTAVIIKLTFEPTKEQVLFFVGWSLVLIVVAYTLGYLAGHRAAYEDSLHRATMGVAQATGRMLTTLYRNPDRYGMPVPKEPPAATAPALLRGAGDDSNFDGEYEQFQWDV